MFLLVSYLFSFFYKDDSEWSFNHSLSLQTKLSSSFRIGLLVETTDDSVVTQDYLYTVP